MSYLLDKQIKKQRFYYGAFFIIVFLFLIYFRSGIFGGLSFVSHKFFRPVLVVGGKFSQKLESIGSFFVSKNSLNKENENLKLELDQNKALMMNYDSVLAENISLKDILGRKNEKVAMILSAILSKPNQSPYDTLVIDTGVEQGLHAGDIVFAFGNIPIGHVSDVYPNSSKVVLFSSSGEKTQVVLSGKNIFLEAVGRGGGNFEIKIPRDLDLKNGDQVVLPGITPYVLGLVQTVISDPRDPFIKALLASPVNIQELKFVQVESQK